MPISVTCGTCQKHYKVKSVLAGRQFRCKACGNMIDVPASEESDSEDNFLAALDEAVAAGGETYAIATPQRTPTAPHLTTSRPESDSHFETPSWADVLQSPFDEEVMAMAFLLLINYFLWIGGAFAVGVAAMIVGLMFGSAGLGWVGALVVGVGAVYYCLRMYAYYFGQWFAICERFALGRMLSRQDEVWYIILGFALGVTALAMLPGAISIPFSSLVLKSESVAILSWIIGYLWFMLYWPMGTAVAILNRSLNPVTVVTWIGTCFIDYMVFFCVSTVFAATIVGTYLGSVWVLSQAFPDGGNIMQFLVFAATFIVGQYVVLALFAMLGTMLRRHEFELDYEGE